MNDAEAYRDRIAEALSTGWRFADLHSSADAAHIRTLLAHPSGATRLETARVANGVAPSIVDIAPSAGWDERETHELAGLRFAGHDPLRPLLDHHAPLERWTVPVRGHDPYQVAVGPIHAGVIESGHFRFQVVGDRILHIDVRLFYKHRGLEQAAQGAPLEKGLAHIARACAGCAVANTVAYAQACEDSLGLTPTPELARIRTVLLELERTWNHLNDISAVCAGVGLAAGNTRFAALVEQARRLNATLTGHRFLFDTIRIGKSRINLTSEQIETARAELSAIEADTARSWRELQFNASFQDRLIDVGTVTADNASTLGAVGPAARASGIGHDLRSSAHHLAYPDKFEPATPAHPTGDVRARLEQRKLELTQTFKILDRLLDRPFTAETAIPGGPIRSLGIGRVESPRGATTCIVEQHNGRIERLRLRTGSYANWPIVAHAAQDNLLPDFPLINKSFELCYACVDR